MPWINRTPIALASVLSLSPQQARAAVEASDSHPTSPRSNEVGLEQGAADAPPFLEWSVGAEAGFLMVASHIIQLSNDGTRFDYRDDGGQDVLFPFSRYSTEFRLRRQHEVIFLYQPLTFTAETVLSRDTTFDGIVFPAGTPLNSTYGFPFWRFSYLYDFLPRRRDALAIGASLQVRDATITFTSADGTQRVDRRDVGPVPALKFRGRWGLNDALWLGTEIDGMYAPISVLNGSDEEITGAILDSSLRIGLDFTHQTAVFFNLRYLGGGSVGTESDPTPPSDGYTKNWIHLITLSLGVEFEPPVVVDPSP